MDYFSVTAILSEKLFSAAGNRSAGMDALANQALSSGIEKYQAKDFKAAAREFKRAFGLSPYSNFAYDATKYQAMAYRQLDQPQEAIQAYKRALQVSPNDDRLHLEIGNLYYGEERYSDAITAYEQAVRLYEDPKNRFSLGQAYLKTGRYKDAENQFQKIIQLNPQSPNGYFGMGKAYSAQKKYTEAISQYERAISKDSTLFSAYMEMGITYADAGQMDKAKDLKKLLDLKDPALAETLGEYISKATKPKMLFAWATGTFKYYLPPKSKVAALDDYLANAGEERSFTMTFQFNKEMDRQSIENKFNWTIKRSSTLKPGLQYNNGLQIPSTEISVPLFPTDVYYDASKLTATVRFTLAQNASGDGTIDPSHIEFAFKGVDSDGNKLDTRYDQYMGICKAF